MPTQPHTTIACRFSPFYAAWCPKEFIYADESRITGNPMLEASVVDSTTHTTTQIKIKSEYERRTINRAELTVITLGLEVNRESPILSILTDIAISINTLRKYAIDPQRYIHHPHKDLLELADDIVHTRETLEYKTHIGKVKSQTGATHIDETNEAARSVVEGHIAPDITITCADPPAGGLRTWTHLRKNSQDTTNTHIKLHNLHSDLRKHIKQHISNNTKNPGTAYSNILHKARESGADQTIHAYSNAP